MLSVVMPYTLSPSPSPSSSPSLPPAHAHIAAESGDSEEDSSEDDEEEESVGLLGKRKKPADTTKATPAKKARNDEAKTPQENGECK